jgi:anti-sigma factor RsiW
MIEHAGDALSALLDGELSSPEVAAVRAHVAGCATCAAELEATAAARSWLRALPVAQPPFGTYERVIRPGRRRWGLAATVASAAACLALLGLSAPQRHVTPALAPMVQDHAATASVGDDPVTELVTAGVPVSFQP